MSDNLKNLPIAPFRLTLEAFPSFEESAIRSRSSRIRNHQISASSSSSSTAAKQSSECSQASEDLKGLQPRIRRERRGETVRSDTYKTQMCRFGPKCPYLAKKGGCHFAHSEEERRSFPLKPFSRRQLWNNQMLMTVPPPTPGEALDVPCMGRNFPVFGDYVKKREESEADEKWLAEEIEHLKEMFSRHE
ncbi:hypothetical protein QR680_012010 [Steinernema hermaphroditum]|uniref:Uncharacterized protein n=1 Tax=Steinernema hermaphroditum TaxID=289476 RepID=A0AA39M001_9BILA|nr:hypothetical protein QR680_012010 [Steinernema hermaphroditum]